MALSESGDKVLETCTAETFQPLLDDLFTVAAGAGLGVPLRLVQVSRAQGSPAGGRAPFRLLFLGPLAPVLPQRTYPFSHPALEPFSIFIVPLGPSDGGMRYEAVFS
ncbi:MAG: hypothetical protein DCC58_06960 [Chloroflexi bacterium]|nr:MAG: hypothetical protein DCC58_06960 [Chloroflexota bacterium]